MIEWKKTNATEYKIRGRIPRLLLGFFLPPFLGALFIFFYFGPIALKEAPFMLPIMIIFAFIYAFVFAGIPAFIYSLLMEYLVVPKAKTGALTAIGALLGGISGATPLFLLGGFYFMFESFSLAIMLGVSIGVITSLILKRNYKKHYGEFD